MRLLPLGLMLCGAAGPPMPRRNPRDDVQLAATELATHQPGADHAPTSATAE